MALSILTFSCQVDDINEVDLCQDIPEGTYISNMTNRVLYIDMSSNWARVTTNVNKDYKIFITECNVELIDAQGSIYFPLVSFDDVDGHTLVWSDNLTYVKIN